MRFEPNERVSGFEGAMNLLEREIRGGLAHGFFEISISSELVKDRKRRLVIKAGKTYLFVIAEDELKL